MLELRSISKSYTSDDAPAKIILDGLDLVLQLGEVVVVAGDNGVGKSVLSRILAGAEYATAGSIEVDGSLIAAKRSNWRVRDWPIALLGQELPRSSITTLRDLLVASSLDGRRVAAERKLKLVQLRLAAMGISTQFDLDRTLSEIPLGELQCLLLALSLAKPQPFLVFDEPTAYLSEETADKIWQGIWKVATNDKKGILVFAHPNQGRGQQPNFFLEQGRLTPKTGVPPVTALKASFADVSTNRFGLVICPNQISGRSSCIARAGEVTLVRGPAVPRFMEFAARFTLESAVARRLIPARRGVQIGILPDDAGDSRIAPSLSLLENALVGRWGEIKRRRFNLLSLDHARQVALDTVEAAQLVPRNDLKLAGAHLSSGNRQRLALAREALSSSDVLVAINPFRGLDSDGVTTSIELLLQASRKGKLVLVFSWSGHQSVDFADVQFEFLGDSLKCEWGAFV